MGVELVKRILKGKLKAILAESNHIDGKIDTEYAEITNNLDKIGGPSQADIMQISGLGKKGDKTAESLFGKKLRREKNEEGSSYQFDEKERAAVITAIHQARK